MANDFIKCNTLDTSAFMANDVVRAARQTRELIDLVESLIDRGFRLFDSGPPTNFAGFEAACGIAPGQGQVVFDLLNGTKSALLGTGQSANAVELKNRVG